ncbi:hypothetical protein ACFXAF_33265, partial [Kitasatospora sp. NPDC059463]
MQYSADGQSDGAVTAPQPGFLASVFRDLGVEPDDDDPSGRPAGAPDASPDGPSPDGPPGVGGDEAVAA